MTTYNNFKSTKICGTFQNSNYPDNSILAKAIFDGPIYTTQLKQASDALQPVYTTTSISSINTLRNWYNFDTADISGVTVKNKKGGYDLTLINGAVTSSQILSLDGIDDYAQFSGFIPNFTTGFTVGCWFNATTTTAGSKRVWEFSNLNTTANVNWMALYFSTTSKISLFFKNSSGVSTVFTANSTFSLDTVYHISLTYKIGTNGFNLYINGVLDSSFTVASGNSFNNGTVMNYCKIGSARQNSDTTAYLKGTIDNFYLFESVLSPTEIGYIHSNGINTTATNLGDYIVTTYIPALEQTALTIKKEVLSNSDTTLLTLSSYGNLHVPSITSPTITSINNNITSNTSAISTINTTLPTLATQTYVNTQVASLVNSAPTTLDTLAELAAALGNNPNYATATASLIGTKADTSYVNTQLLFKASVSEVDASIQQIQTSITNINASLAQKATITSTNNALDLKSDKIYVDASFNNIQFQINTISSGSSTEINTLRNNTNDSFTSAFSRIFNTETALEQKANITDMNLKASSLNPIFSGIVYGITPNMVGLGFVNNTSDTDKVISIATQAALDQKASITTTNNLQTQINAINSGVPINIQNELNLKANTSDVTDALYLKANVEDLNTTNLNLSNTNNNLTITNSNFNNLFTNATQPFFGSFDSSSPPVTNGDLHLIHFAIPNNYSKTIGFNFPINYKSSGYIDTSGAVKNIFSTLTSVTYKITKNGLFYSSGPVSLSETSPIPKQYQYYSDVTFTLEEFICNGSFNINIPVTNASSYDSYEAYIVIASTVEDPYRYVYVPESPTYVNYYQGYILNAGITTHYTTGPTITFTNGSAINPYVNASYSTYYDYSNLQYPTNNKVLFPQTIISKNIYASNICNSSFIGDSYVLSKLSLEGIYSFHRNYHCDLSITNHSIYLPFIQPSTHGFIFNIYTTASSLNSSNTLSITGGSAFKQGNNSLLSLISMLPWQKLTIIISSDGVYCVL
jgi:hypothetical protein